MAASEGTFYVDMNIFVYVILLQKGDLWSINTFCNNKTRKSFGQK